MRTGGLAARALGVALSVVVLASAPIGSQQGQGPAAPPRNPSPATMPMDTLQDLFIRFPLTPGQDAYADIDGRHMHRDVVETSCDFSSVP